MSQQEFHGQESPASTVVVVVPVAQRRRTPGFLLLSLLVATVFIMSAISAGAQETAEVLHSFDGRTAPRYPQTLIRGASGDLYGTTAEGGSFDRGTVYRVTPEGEVSLLHSFTPDEGSGYDANLLQGHDGALYGNTQRVLFRLSTTGDFSVLHVFDPDQNDPAPSEVIQADDGNFYAIGPGGAFASGSFMRITPAGAVTLLASFGTDRSNNPRSLIQGADGNFWGTTGCTGCSGRPEGGTIFKVTPTGGMTTQMSSGFVPFLITQAPDGNFYGLMTGGSFNRGQIFRFVPGGSLTTVYEFTDRADGRFPNAFLLGDEGNFYGVTTQGGSSGAGALFKFSPGGAFQVLRAWTSSDDRPDSLVHGLDGRFYGPAFSGGFGAGAVIRVSADGTFAEPIPFLSGPDGAFPASPLIQAANGFFYGTTTHGGRFGLGTAFMSTANGAITQLHAFAGGADGAHPSSGLVQTRDGSFYGTTSVDSGGTVYRMTPEGAVTTIATFVGQIPRGLMAASDGNLYGIAEPRSQPVESVIFRVTPAGAVSTVHRFPYSDAGLVSDLIEATAGQLYGVTSGLSSGRATAFRISLDGATFDTVATLPPMGNAYEGPDRPDRMIRGRDGHLYLSDWSAGRVYRLSLDGAVTLVRELRYGSRLLVQAADGYLYGTFTNGVVFRMGLDGTTRELPPVPYSADDSGMETLMQGDDGFLYGTSYSGGAFKQGVLYRISLMSAAPTEAPGWQLTGVGDLDGDGRADLVWRQPQSGDLATWLMAGGEVKGNTIVSAGVPLAWQVAGTGDLDDDGRSDLLWRNTRTGDVALWLMDGAAVKMSAAVSAGVPLAWQIAGVADFDRDGRADLLWRHAQTGDIALWLMNGATVTRSVIVSSGVPLAWQIVGLAGSVDDGRAKIVWRHAQTGDVAVWLMAGPVVERTAILSAGVPLAWQLVAVADHHPDGRIDLIWRDDQRGDVAIWRAELTSVTRSAVLLRAAPLTSQIAAVGDLDGDGTVDLIWRQTPTGSVSVWLIGGTGIN